MEGIALLGLMVQALAGWLILWVSLIGFVLIAPVSIYTASYGVRLAHWLPRRKLEIAFAIFLAIVSVRFLLSLL